MKRTENKRRVVSFFLYVRVCSVVVVFVVIVVVVVLTFKRLSHKLLASCN